MRRQSSFNFGASHIKHFKKFRFIMFMTKQVTYFFIFQSQRMIQLSHLEHPIRWEKEVMS